MARNLPTNSAPEVAEFHSYKSVSLQLWSGAGSATAGAEPIDGLWPYVRYFTLLSDKTGTTRARRGLNPVSRWLRSDHRARHTTGNAAKTPQPAAWRVARRPGLLSDFQRLFKTPKLYHCWRICLHNDPFLTIMPIAFESCGHHKEYHDSRGRTASAHNLPEPQATAVGPRQMPGWQYAHTPRFQKEVSL